jgi:TolB protein
MFIKILLYVQVFFFLVIITGISTGTLAQKIVYNFYDSLNKNYEIMVSNTDGSNQKNITNNPSTDWVYYTYKDVLYFISDRDTCSRCFFLYSSNSDGANPKKISDLMLEDSWMSSRNNGGEMIVSGRHQKSRNQLYLMNTKDGSYIQITSDTGAFYNDPTFVNDGKQIAFRYKKEKRNRNMKTEIWIMNANGSDAKQLTHYPSSDTTAPWYAYHAGAPKWNAAKGYISFQSMQKGKYHIYAITTDGKKQWQITNTLENEGWHDWSADGNWLIYDTFDDDQRAFDIKLLNIITGEQNWITRGGWKLEYCPVFIEK